jgi:hypothetical protein
MGKNAVFCTHGTESPVSVKYGDFLDHLYFSKRALFHAGSQTITLASKQKETHCHPFY